MDNLGLLKPVLIALILSSVVLGIWQGPFGDAFLGLTFCYLSFNVKFRVFCPGGGIGRRARFRI